MPPLTFLFASRVIELSVQVGRVLRLCLVLYRLILLYQFPAPHNMPISSRWSSAPTRGCMRSQPDRVKPEAGSLIQVSNIFTLRSRLNLVLSFSLCLAIG